MHSWHRTETFRAKRCSQLSSQSLFRRHGFDGGRHRVRWGWSGASGTVVSAGHATNLGSSSTRRFAEVVLRWAQLHLVESCHCSCVAVTNNVGSSCLSSPKQVLLSFAGQQRERDVTAPWRTPRECEALNHPVPLSADIPLARLFDKGFGAESRKVHTTFLLDGSEKYQPWNLTRPSPKEYPCPSLALTTRICSPHEGNSCSVFRKGALSSRAAAGPHPGLPPRLPPRPDSPY